LGYLFLGLAEHPEGVLRDEKTYFGILMLFSVTSPLKSALSGFFTGVGHTWVVMWASILSNAVNILLDYALIFGNFGAPELGIAGAAIATVIAEFFCVAFYLVAYHSPIYARFNTRSEWGIDRQLMAKLIRFGLPSGIQLAMEFAAFSFFLMLTGRLIAEEAVASSIALNINNIAVMPILGISFAVTTLVGQYQGAQAHAMAARAGWAAVGMGQVFMLLAALSFVLMPDAYISLFARDAMQSLDVGKIRESTSVLLIILAAWGLFDTCSLILAGALRGAGDTRFVMWYSLGVAWLMYMPALGALVLTDRDTLLPMWLCTAGWVGFLATGFLARFAGGRWKSIQVVDNPAT
jgi:MATE family multidrug resistance protein